MSQLILLLFISFSVGNIGRICLFEQQVNGYIYEIIAFLFLVILVSKYKSKPFQDSSWLFKLILIFIGYLVFSFLMEITQFKPWENMVSLLYLLRLIFYFVFFYYLKYDLGKSLSDRKVILRGILLFVLLTILFSAIQYFFYPDLRNLLYAGWDPHLYRLFGTYLDTSTAGAIFGLVFFLLIIRGESLVKNAYLRNLLIFTFLLFIVLTFSRSLYLSVFITTLVMTAVRKWYRALIFFLVGFVLLVFLVPKPSGEGVNLARIYTIESRI